MTQPGAEGAGPAGLATRDLAVGRGGRLLVEGLGVTLAAGEVLLLRGANGAGKSSLLRVLAGLARPLAGCVLREGRPIAEDPEGHAARLSWLGHRDGLKALLTVSEHLGFWGAAASGGAALERVGLARLAQAPVGILSAGQRRRLALARLMLAGRPLWLLDEPAAALDAGGTGLLLDLLAEHRRAGGAAVIASHDPWTPPGARLLTLGAP